MTIFAACLERLGLSIRQASQLLDVPENTIKSLSSGRRRVPDGMWGELRAYETKIGERSLAIEDAIDEAGDASARINLKLLAYDRMGLMGLADYVLNSDIDVASIDLQFRTAEHDA